MRVKPKPDKPPAHRTTVSMPEALWTDAEARMTTRKHESFSEYVAWLIRRDLGYDDAAPVRAVHSSHIRRYPHEPTTPDQLNETP